MSRTPIHVQLTTNKESAQHTSKQKNSNKMLPSGDRAKKVSTKKKITTPRSLELPLPSSPSRNPKETSTQPCRATAAATTATIIASSTIAIRSAVLKHQIRTDDHRLVLARSHTLVAPSSFLTLITLLTGMNIRASLLRAKLVAQ